MALGGDAVYCWTWPSSSAKRGLRVVKVADGGIRILGRRRRREEWIAQSVKSQVGDLEVAGECRRCSAGTEGEERFIVVVDEISDWCVGEQ